MTKDSLALATPTRWYVLTGAPCAGKTTLIRRLAARGYATVPEASRQYLEEQLALGRTVAEIRADDAAYQRTMLRRKREVEASLDSQQRVFLDRGMPDSISYFRKAGLPEQEAIEASLSKRYCQVFLLERLPLVADGFRTEDEALAKTIERWLADDYTALGYPIHRVPPVSVEERLAYILKTAELPLEDLPRETTGRCS